MNINPYVFRNYDIRGKVGDDIDAEKAEAIGKAYGTFLRRRRIRQAVVGRDCRLSGPEYQDAFMRGLVSTGVSIIDIGMVMTQMMYYAQYRFQTNGGAMITASHNPNNYNGFKLAVGFSKTTETDEVREIHSYTINDRYFIADAPEKIEKADITEDYFHDVLKRVEVKKKFRIVVDCGHGTTGAYIPEILRRAGCEVIGRNIEVDGRFPKGTPDPTSREVMERVAKVVIEEKADLGCAFDGDGDRVGVVDKTGNILWNDVLVAIFSKEILERFPGSKIVYNTLCSQIVKDTISKNGGIPIMWKTGHSFIKSKIAEENAVFGGELSGHFFFADNAYGHDDGSYTIMRVLEYLSEKNMGLDELYAGFPRLISSPEIKIGCPDDRKSGVIADISERFKKDFPGVTEVTDGSVIPGDDGVRADFEDGMIVFRYSQNGPYITVRFEGKDQETYEERKKYVKKTLERYPEMNWEDELCVNLSSLM